MKMDWNTTGAIVFGVVFVTLGALVALGKLPADMLGILVAWLVPSPIGIGKGPPAPPPGAS